MKLTLAIMLVSSNSSALNCSLPIATEGISNLAPYMIIVGKGVIPPLFGSILSFWDTPLLLSDSFNQLINNFKGQSFSTHGWRHLNRQSFI